MVLQLHLYEGLLLLLPACCHLLLLKLAQSGDEALSLLAAIPVRVIDLEVQEGLLHLPLLSLIR
jgi:hypothetical protein